MSYEYKSHMNTKVRGCEHVSFIVFFSGKFRCELTAESCCTATHCNTLQHTATHCNMYAWVINSRVRWLLSTIAVCCSVLLLCCSAAVWLLSISTRRIGGASPRPASLETKFLKSQLAAQCTIENHYRTDFWETCRFPPAESAALHKGRLWSRSHLHHRQVCQKSVH